MEIQRNMSIILNMFRSRRKQSLSEFAEDLEISRSHLQALLAQKSSPRIDTVEHIANKLGIEPRVLLSGSFVDAQIDVIEQLLGLINSLGEIPDDKRKEFAKLIYEIVKLWGEEEVEERDK